MAHPLAALAQPLRYASARDFANLAQVKDLRTPLLAAVERGRATLSAERLATLAEAATTIDAAEPALRQRAIRRVLAVLEAEGLSVGASATPAPAEPPPASAPVDDPGEARENTSSPDRGGGASGTRASSRRRQKEPEAAEGGRKAARLSIAPTSGPLAMPLKSVGVRLSPRLVGLLNKRGMSRVGDVLFLLPRTYEDRRTLKRVAQLRAGERSTILVDVRRVEEGRGRRQFRAVLGDSSGTIAATYFQGGPWLKARFPLGKRLVVSGEVRQSTYGWEMPHPEVEPADDVETSLVHFNRIVPVYPGFERNEQRLVRELAHHVVERYAAALEDPVPPAVLARTGVRPLAWALSTIHFPDPSEPLAPLIAHRSAAHQRLAFDELFFLQLGMALRRQGVKVQTGLPLDAGPDSVARALAVLPFAPTGAQRRVVEQIARDLARPEPMSRLLQGDVGSGKTAVAMVAAALAVRAGVQVAVMAPTEILAEQHARSFTRVLGPHGMSVGLLTGGGTSSRRARDRADLASGRTAIAVGTHALIQQGVDFKALGLVIIDEQHRFGVMQRQALSGKGANPHVLVMTATPIPRTLAMTLYGDLDVSVIDELPPGRTPIQTAVLVETGRARMMELLRAELGQGRQAYVVYPLVEESEKSDLTAATDGAEALAAQLAPFRVGLVHGRMKADEKDHVMGRFRDHQLDVLVSTTVIEVGVDVPNASVMVIEHAERFGLSQLHQLRGRVGRGAARSYCVLMASYARSEDSRTRLEVMEETTDGFLIAQRDLELRGPGEFLGTRQSGLPELAVADLAADQPLLERAQEEARAIVQADPRLERPEHRGLWRSLEERWEGRLALARVG